MKCVIVGGGIAGLCAARDLAKRGWETVLVEPRARLGGRIFTVESKGIAVELGPEFIHGNPRETLDLVDKKEVLPLDEAQDVWWEGRRLEVPELWDEIERFNKEIVDEQPDHPIQQDIDRFHANTLIKALVHNFFEGFNASDARRMSAGALKRENSRAPSDAMDSSRLLTGYGHLVHQLEKELRSSGGEILLESRVSRVEWEKNRVSVEIRSQDLVREEEAQAVLLTIPTPHYNLPKDHPLHIEFSPPIAAHLFAAKHLPLGPVVKLVMLFKEPLWPKKPADIHFVHSPSLHFGARWSWDWNRQFVVTNWSGGTRAEYFKMNSREEILETCLHELSAVSGEPLSKIRELLEEWYYHDWVNDPYSLGAYSYVETGATSARETLARPVEGTLFFAGEATMDDGSAGTVHGAIRSGLRAVQEILKNSV